MLKFLTAASFVSTASAAGVVTYDWPADGTSNTVFGTALTVLDPIKDGSTLNDQVKVDTDEGTYIGVFAANPSDHSYVVPTSHTELASGGPITKVACAATTDCVLDLFKGDDRLNPVPAGKYHVLAVDGTDLIYANAVSTDKLQVTINPYVSAWGVSSSVQATSTIERGTDIIVTWDGYAENDIIEYRHSLGGGATALVECPVDYHVITAAEEAAGRGTIALKTSGATEAAAVGFAIPGDHTISGLSQADHYTVPIASATTANCAPGTTVGVARTVTIADTDLIYITGNAVADTSAGNKVTAHEAGSKISVTYTLNSGASTSGMYVGLFLANDKPTSHIVDPDHTAGHPLSAAFLPVGISGSGTIELDTPIQADGGAAGVDYIVYFFNSNDIFFEPIADTSYTSVSATSLLDSNTGPHVQAAFANHQTDIQLVSAPTGEPSGQPTGEPSGEPTAVPTSPTGQPTGIPTSSPSFVEEPWGEYVWTEKRHRKAGMCENQCSGHGTCEVNGNCKCFKGLDGEDEWTGPDCSSRTCPFDFAWVGSSINSNNLHPWAECSNKGICDRGTGECQCFTGYEGAACQRTVCPDNCNDQGTCWPEKHLASKAGRVYDAPWDAMKHVGCLCDAGYRGPACDQQECPSGADPLSGYGNEAGRDCSGRGICDYSNGICACFTGFFGTRCQHQTTVM
jgi:hypothetical protein